MVLHVEDMRQQAAAADPLALKVLYNLGARTTQHYRNCLDELAVLTRLPRHENLHRLLFWFRPEEPTEDVLWHAPLKYLLQYLQTKKPTDGRRAHPQALCFRAFPFDLEAFLGSALRAGPGPK